MSNKVKVVGDKHGNIIGVYESNSEYGYVRVEQIVSQIDPKGWLKNSKRSAFIKGKVDDLISADFELGKELPGRIVVIESLVPFNVENPDRDLKIAGDTGIICRLHDEPIYRQSFYTSNSNATDDLIMHTNADEIREVQAASRMLASFKNKEEEVTL